MSNKIAIKQILLTAKSRGP